MIFGEKIAAIRNEKGWTQQELAEMIGVERQAVSAWERNVKEPSKENLMTLVEVLGVPLSAISNYNDTPDPRSDEANGEEEPDIDVDQVEDYVNSRKRRYSLASKEIGVYLVGGAGTIVLAQIMSLLNVRPWLRLLILGAIVGVGAMLIRQIRCRDRWDADLFLWVTEKGHSYSSGAKRLIQEKSELYRIDGVVAGIGAICLIMAFLAWALFGVGNEGIRMSCYMIAVAASLVWLGPVFDKWMVYRDLWIKCDYQ